MTEGLQGKGAVRWYTCQSSLSFTLYARPTPLLKACLRNSFFDEPLQWILLFQINIVAQFDFLTHSSLIAPCRQALA